jgi:hypothetical protein
MGIECQLVIYVYTEDFICPASWVWMFGVITLNRVYSLGVITVRFIVIVCYVNVLVHWSTPCVEQHKL